MCKHRQYYLYPYLRIPFLFFFTPSFSPHVHLQLVSFLACTFCFSTKKGKHFFVVPSNICLGSYYQFPRSYVRSMQTILQFARIFLKKRFTPYHPLSNTSLSSELERVLYSV